MQLGELNALVLRIMIKLKPKIFLETERLLLRELMPSDAEGLFELDSDSE